MCCTIQPIEVSIVQLDFSWVIAREFSDLRVLYWSNVDWDYFPKARHYVNYFEAELSVDAWGWTKL